MMSLKTVYPPSTSKNTHTFYRERNILKEPYPTSDHKPHSSSGCRTVTPSGFVLEIFSVLYGEPLHFKDYNLSDQKVSRPGLHAL